MLNSLAAYLYRPFLDLGPSPRVPSFSSLAVEFDWKRLTEDPTWPRLHTSHNEAFRLELQRLVGIDSYRISAPHDLPEPLRTARWGFLCQQIIDWRTLAGGTQVRLAELLSRLGFFRLVLELLADVGSKSATAADAAALAYAETWAAYRLFSDDPSCEYCVDDFGRLAEEVPAGVTKVDACYQMVVQHARDRSDLKVCEQWQPLHRDAIEGARHLLTPFEYQRLVSRYHRVEAFLPQMRRDGAGTTREMVAAERLARELPRSNYGHAVAADEMLYPVLESRMQEMLWLGEGERALEFVDEYISLAPTSSRAWIHRGDVLYGLERTRDALDAFRRARRYAPPGAEVAHFKIGVCEEELGDIGRAIDHYVQTLTLDPLSTTASEALAGIANAHGDPVIADYAAAAAAALTARQEALPEGVAQESAYRQIPPPMPAPAKPTTLGT